MKTTYIKHKIANLISISKIVTVHYFEFDKNYKNDGESHDFWEMVYCDCGEVLIKAKSLKYRLRQGEAIFHKPNEFHSLSTNGIDAPNVFIISFVCSSKAMNYFRNKKIKIPAKLRSYIAKIIEESRSTFVLPFNDPNLRELVLSENAPIGGQQMIRTYLEQLMIMLIRSDNMSFDTRVFPTKASVDNHLVSEMLGILEGGIYKKNTVTELCRVLNYSRTYLSRLFISTCGYTISEYFSVLKISEAKRLIRENNYNFTQISDMLCFDNPHYFSRVFKKITKMSPTEYKCSLKAD